MTYHTRHPRRRLKWMCVCQGGNVRSGALKNILNYNFGQDALSVSAEKNSAETLAMLYDWADRVVWLTPDVKQWWPSRLSLSKVALVDVGPDRFGSPLHPELCGMLLPVASAWKARDWNLRETAVVD